jgi:hypothetical protein
VETVRNLLKLSRKSEHMAVGIRRADYAIPLYPPKLALTSPTSGGRSIGIVRSRTQATEFVLFVIPVTGRERL